MAREHCKNKGEEEAGGPYFLADGRCESRDVGGIELINCMTTPHVIMDLDGN